MYTRRISNCLGGLKTYSTSNSLGNIITSNTSVGIGITAPSSLLHVNGTLTVPTMATTNLLSTNNSLTNLIITNLSSGNNTCVFNSTIFQNNIADTIRSINLNFSTSTTNNFISTNSSINNLAITNISASSCTINNLIANNVTVGNIKGVGAVPTGAVLMWSSESAPEGFLLCDGSSVLISSWGNLFGVIGYTYGGTGDNFNLPDLKGRVPVGLGTTISTGTLGLKSGSETHTLTINQIPTHNHGEGSTDVLQSHDHILNYNITDPTNTSSSQFSGSFEINFSSFFSNQFSTTLSGSHSHSFTTGNIGNNTAHENMQSFIVINYIIKT